MTKTHLYIVIEYLAKIICTHDTIEMNKCNCG